MKPIPKFKLNQNSPFVRHDAFNNGNASQNKRELFYIQNQLEN